MAATGFVVYYLFETLGLVPVHGEISARAGFTLAGLAPGTILNGVFLVIATVFGLLLVKGKNRMPGNRVVKDPVTEAELTVKNADYCTIYDETIYYFESESNRDQFKRDPESYIQRDEDHGEVDLP
jgi:YHS domain-containing protein